MSNQDTRRDPQCEIHEYLMGDGRCSCIAWRKNNPIQQDMKMQIDSDWLRKKTAEPGKESC